MPDQRSATDCSARTRRCRRIHAAWQFPALGSAAAAASVAPTSASPNVSLPLPAGAIVDRIWVREDQRRGQLVRSTEGTVTGSLSLWGLPEGLVFKGHLHKATCAAGGGGHYMNDPAGSVDNVNEMWFECTTNSAGRCLVSPIHSQAQSWPNSSKAVFHSQSKRKSRAEPKGKANAAT